MGRATTQILSRTRHIGVMVHNAATIGTVQPMALVSSLRYQSETVGEITVAQSHTPLSSVLTDYRYQLQRHPGSESDCGGLPDPQTAAGARGSQELAPKEQGSSAATGPLAAQDQAALPHLRHHFHRSPQASAQLVCLLCSQSRAAHVGEMRSNGTGRAWDHSHLSAA